MRIGARTSSAGKPVRSLVIAAALVLSAAVGGCANIDRAIQPPPVNPSSPIAGYAERVSHENFPTPTFSEVPPAPIDVRPASGYKAVVTEEVQNRRDLAAWQAAHQPPPSDTAAWAELQRRKIPADRATPVPQTQDAESEAFAKRLREQADKPPAQ